ncbi:MAG: ScyD/ScyE family protein [Bryobacteraceae bacterium]|nr:ScyD/ScyE family protein [Bryobacteraceae bacterium]
MLAALPLSWAQSSTSEVVATGLLEPGRVRMTPRGNLLIAESGRDKNSGRLSIVSTSGARRSLLEGLPSGVSQQGEASGPADFAGMGRMLYVLIGAGDAEVAGPTPGTAGLNPRGVASPLLSSLLVFRLSAEVDEVQTPFRLDPQQHRAIWDGTSPVMLRNEQGQTAEVEMVADIADVIPDPVSIWRASNPYSLVVGGDTAWIADASLDAILRVDLRGGRSRVAKRFGKVPNTIPVGPPVTDTVPNKILPYGEEFLVVEMTGFPFAPGNGRIEILDPRSGNTRPFLFGLTMPIDVAWQDRGASQRARFLTLEYSTAYLAQPAGPGRLTVYDTPEGRAVKSDLTTPSSMAMGPGGDIYITERVPGRLLRVRITQP